MKLFYAVSAMVLIILTIHFFSSIPDGNPGICEGNPEICGESPTPPAENPDETRHELNLDLVDDFARSAMEMLAALVIIALFVERASEVFISNARSAERNRREKPIKVFQKKLDAIREEIKNIESDGEPKDARFQAIREMIPKLSENEREFEDFRSETRFIVMIFSVILATAIALAGVRALSPLIENELKVLHGYQWAIFQIVDILLTVSLISGGSTGLHKIIRAIGDTLPRRPPGQVG